MWRNQILKSFEYVWDSISTFVFEQPFIFVIISLLIVLSSISRVLKSYLKKKYIDPYEWWWNTDNKDFYVKYYQKIQYVDIFWAIIGFILIFIYLLTKNTIVWTVWAVWVWSILITFQSFSISLFSYFLLIKNYRIWDTIRVCVNWENIQWQILYIKLLHVWLSWKNDFWENTWEFFRIPNYKMWENPITKVDLSLDGYTKDSITIIYDHKIFKESFSDFSENLKNFLDKFFRVRSASNVSYFKSYIWVKYKMDYKYDWDGKACIRIWFVEKRSKIKQIKKKILSFVEDLKKNE